MRHNTFLILLQTEWLILLQKEWSSKFIACASACHNLIGLSKSRHKSLFCDKMMRARGAPPPHWSLSASAQYLVSIRPTKPSCTVKTGTLKA